MQQRRQGIGDKVILLGATLVREQGDFTAAQGDFTTAQVYLEPREDRFQPLVGGETGSGGRSFERKGQGWKRGRAQKITLSTILITLSPMP
jgi:hypothetical protein